MRRRSGPAFPAAPYWVSRWCRCNDALDGSEAFQVQLSAARTTRCHGPRRLRQRGHGLRRARQPHRLQHRDQRPLSNITGAPHHSGAAGVGCGPIRQRHCPTVPVRTSSTHPQRALRRRAVLRGQLPGASDVHRHQLLRPRGEGMRARNRLRQRPHLGVPRARRDPRPGCRSSPPADLWARCRASASATRTWARGSGPGPWGPTAPSFSPS